MIEVFWASGSPNSWRVLLGLELKGLPYESRLIELGRAEQRTPSFLAMNPRGKVPVLKDDDYIVYESVAILAYLDRKYDQGTKLFGDGPEALGKVWQQVSEWTSYVEPAILEFARPIFYGRAAEQAPRLREIVDFLMVEYGVLESRLTLDEWIVGDTPTAAECLVYPTTQYLLRAARKDDARALDLGLLPFEERFPAVARWMRSVESLPGYERTYPPHWRPAPILPSPPVTIPDPVVLVPDPPPAE
ncbi:MAG: glutathione S-transferase family protein [Deltaproteobacteria bacterium]|nr:glutathione S-transferase family protein [Deltaproteobacteria bacterium]